MSTKSPQDPTSAEKPPCESDNAICSPWILTSQEMPEMADIVWLFNGVNVWIGSRENDPEGWMYSNLYGSEYWDGEKWCGDTEIDDDYQPTHWMPLPTPPL